MTPRSDKLRIPALDFLRGCLILMMLGYHFFWDLGYFGYINFSSVVSGKGLLVAQCIGASFIFLSGISISLLFSSISFNGYVFLLKLIKILGIAAIISLTTWLINPQSFIYFGILHLLSLCYLLAFFTLQFQTKFVVYIILTTLYLVHTFELKFDISPFWSWVGITKEIPLSNDFYPLIPWGIYFFIGIVFSDFLLKKIKTLNIENWLNNPDQLTLKLKIILWAGRKSLLIYICHQPLFFSLFLSFNALMSN